MSIKNFKENISNCLKEIQNKNYTFSEAKKFTLVYVLAFFLIVSLIPSNDGNKSKSVKKPKDKKEQKVSKENYAFIGDIMCRNKYGGTFYYSITKNSISHYRTVSPGVDYNPKGYYSLTQNKNGYVKWDMGGENYYSVNDKKMYMVLGGKPTVISTCN